MTKRRQKTRAELQRELIEAHAQLAHVYHFASVELPKAGEALKASGVLVTLHALGGREITKPFVIRDGFSADTIAALQRDLSRSYDSAVMYKPKGAK